MAKQLMGKAPLSLVRTVNSSLEYVYAGKPVPRGADPADVRRLLDEGFLAEEELPDAEPVAEQESVEDGPKPPAKTANKESWVDFRVAQLGEVGEQHRAEFDALTKEQLQDDACLLGVSGQD